jgi:hypothetical protein
MKELRKTRKRKEKEKEKRIKGQGEPFRPSKEKNPRPNRGKNPKRYPLPLFYTPIGGTHLSSSISSRFFLALTTPETDYSPLKIPITPCLN